MVKEYIPSRVAFLNPHVFRTTGKYATSKLLLAREEQITGSSAMPAAIINITHVTELKIVRRTFEILLKLIILQKFIIEPEVSQAPFVQAQACSFSFFRQWLKLQSKSY